MSMLSGPPLALNLYGAVLLLAMAPAWLRSGHDRRTIGGVGVWAKPLKFMAALALFAVTTAALMQAAGAGAVGALWRIAALVIATATFEVTYITLQASRAQPSHYNTRDTLHTLLTVLMALGAIGLTASQAWLAWAIVQSNPDWRVSVPVLGVVTGLLVAWILGTVSGFMLATHRAPSGPGLPVVGWHRHGDLRPAHFLGVHAQQCIPLCGLLVPSVTSFAALVLLYVLAWAALTRRARPRHSLSTN